MLSLIKRRSNAAFIFLLFVAFMVFKWTPSHAHLNAQHDHGSERHQHSIEAHAHQPAVFHAEPKALDHPQMDEGKIVDLDHDQNSSNGKGFDNPAALFAFVYYLPLIQSGEIALPECCNSPPRQHYTHPGQPRAPPQLS